MTAWWASMADQLRWRRRWGRKVPWLLLKILVTLIYLFIFSPIFVTAAVSFNEASRSRFPPVGFTLRWWQEAISNRMAGPDPVQFAACYPDRHIRLRSGSSARHLPLFDTAFLGARRCSPCPWARCFCQRLSPASGFYSSCTSPAWAIILVSGR